MYISLSKVKYICVFHVMINAHIGTESMHLYKGAFRPCVKNKHTSLLSVTLYMISSTNLVAVFVRLCNINFGNLVFAINV